MSLALFLCTVATGSRALGQDSANLLQQAEKLTELAEYERALIDCDAAIQSIEAQPSRLSRNPELSRAFFLKAYLHWIYKKSEADALAALQQGIKADPLFDPTSPLLTPPVLQEAIKEFLSGPCLSVRNAHNLQLKGDYCSAFEALCPVTQSNSCPLLNDITPILMNELQGSCDKTYVQGSCVAETCVPDKRIAVFPLIISDPHGDGSSLVTNNMVVNQLMDMLPGFDVFLLDSKYVRDLISELGLVNLRNFMSESFVDICLDTDHLSESEIKAGSLCGQYRTAMDRLFHDQCTSNIVFVLLENTGTGREREIYVRMCLYNESSPYTAEVKDGSPKFNNPDKAEYTLGKRLVEVKNYLRSKGML